MAQGSAIEASVRSAIDAGDTASATDQIVRALGPEVLAYLLATHPNLGIAEDAFSLCCERLWQTLHQFDWRCSLRTWVYRLARNAVVDVVRGRGVVARRAKPLSWAPEFEQLVQRVRTETLRRYKTERRTALLELRETLSEADRELLVLRFEREMKWVEIAEVIGEVSDGAELKREAARPRKRAQLVRERLVKLGRERGLLT